MVQAQAGVTDFQENMEALKHNFILSGYFKKRGYEDSGDLTANRIGGLPQGAPLKAFTFTAKQLFDTRDSAKLKNEKSLDAGGAYLAGNKFGFAVVVVSTGIREYLVENFGFDDSQLKTLGMGKQTGANLDADWGSIQILIFPAGTAMPPDQPAPPKNSSITDAAQPAQVTTAGTQKP